MSSAEDTSPGIVTASAPAESSADESVPIVQAESVSPVPAEPPEEPGDGNVPEGATKPLPKVSAVAHEVRVRVTGARPGGDGGERDLFSETTSTVLVFEKGGVIRLTAAVAPGQLLFLTNEDSQQEVVAQVVRKRAYKPTECYVELEFTESAPKFWGMEFSAGTALLPKDENEAEAAELVASAETSADDPGDTAPAPNAQEVATLKKEVEALRGQLKLLQKANTPQEDEPTKPTEEAKTVPAKEELAANWEPAPTPQVQESVPPPMAAPETPIASDEALGTVSKSPLSVSEAPLKAPFISKSLPLDGASLPKELKAAQELSPPKPQQFEFGSLAKKKISFRARGNFTPGFRSGILRVALLAMVLAGTVFGAAWYKHWLPWQPAAKRIEVASWMVPTSTPSPAQPVAKTGSAAPVETRSGGRKTSTEASTASKVNAPLTITVHENVPEPEAAKEAPPEPPVQPVSRAESKPAASLARHSAARTSEPASGIAPVSIPADDGTTVPPKLIRSAKAVASLDDLRDFETGSVIIEAVVDATGDVISANVLSGPPSLRKPAVDAIKNYKYEPATRNGKPVPARVSVRIQFHFE